MHLIRNKSYVLDLQVDWAQMMMHVKTATSHKKSVNKKKNNYKWNNASFNRNN